YRDKGRLERFVEEVDLRSFRLKIQSIGALERLSGLATSLNFVPIVVNLHVSMNQEFETLETESGRTGIMGIRACGHETFEIRGTLGLHA
ncbi:hypothetical protein ACLOJK_000504, partial [Asimina triloba]